MRSNTESEIPQEEEDESEEFVVCYHGDADRIWIANVPEHADADPSGGGSLNIVEATYGSSAAKASMVTDIVANKVENGKLEFGEGQGMNLVNVAVYVVNV